MTLFHLPEAPDVPMTVDERLDNIDARLDVLIAGIKEILGEVVALRERFDRAR